MAATAMWGWTTSFCLVSLAAARQRPPDGDRWSDPWSTGGRDPYGTGGDDNGDDDGDDDSDDDSQALIIGGFVFGAILLATAAIITALYCLKKAKRPKRIAAQEPPSKHVAVIGARHGLPGGKLPYSSVHGSSKAPGRPVTTSHLDLPYNVPAKGPTPLDGGRLLQLNDIIPETRLPPVTRCSPPPPYSK